jgi:regulator of sigma E protease
VENVTPGTPMAERDLLRAGDVVTAMDGASTRYYAQFTNAADKKFEQAAAAPSAEPRIDFTLDVENDGQARRVEFSGVSREEFGRLFDTEKSLVLRLPAVIGGIGPNQPADKAGLEAGDRIVEIDGKPTETWAQMAEIIRAKAGEPCVLTYERNGERKTIEITPVRNPLDENNAGMIGVTNGGLETEIIHPFGFFEALVKAPVATAAATVNLVVVQARFIARATLSELGRGAGGPIAIAVLTTRSAKLGFRSWLDWFITLNLLLLILNILPIPVLDGGFILLAFVEAAIRRPVPPKILQPIYAVFVCLFIGLILFVSALDIRNWFF